MQPLRDCGGYVEVRIAGVEVRLDHVIVQRVWKCAGCSTKRPKHSLAYAVDHSAPRHAQLIARRDWARFARLWCPSCALPKAPRDESDTLPLEPAS